MDDRNILIPGLGPPSYNQSDCKGCRWLRPCCMGLLVAFLMMFTFATIMFSLYLLKDEIDDVRTRDMIIIKALMEKHNIHFDDDDFGGSGDGGWNRHTSPYPTPWFTTMSDWFYRSTTTPRPEWYDATTKGADDWNYFATTARYDWNSQPSTTERSSDWNSYTTAEPYTTDQDSLWEKEWEESY